MGIINHIFYLLFLYKVKNFLLVIYDILLIINYHTYYFGEQSRIEDIFS